MSVALIVGIKAEKTFLLVSRLRRLPPPRRSWGTPSCWTTILRLDSDTAGLPWLSTRMCSMGCIWWMVSLCEVNHQPFTTCTLPTFDGYWFGHRRWRENEWYGEKLTSIVAYDSYFWNSSILSFHGNFIKKRKPRNNICGYNGVQKSFFHSFIE